MDKRYKAKIGPMYISFVSTFSVDITLVPDRKRARYLTEKEIDIVRTYFPNAEIKAFSVVADEGGF